MRSRRLPNRSLSDPVAGTTRQVLSSLGLDVRRHDRDRFVTALFAPADRRESLFALYAFNAELARIRDSVSEPLLGEIRLQWWRDAVARLHGGGEIAHPVAVGLGAAMRSQGLSRERLDRLIDARAADLSDEPPADMAALEAYVAGTAGTLAVLAVEALGADEASAAEAAHHAGMGWGLTGVLRAAPFRARAGRAALPADLMAAHDVTVGSLNTRPAAQGVIAVARSVATRAREHLHQARIRRAAVPRRARAALLTVPLADIYLARFERARYDLTDTGWSAVRPAVLRLAIRSLISGY